jgi:alkylhydroperoxidase family enzyme
MVRGLTRELPRLGLGLVGGAGAGAMVAGNWAAVRGAVVWEGTADLIGGFPGFAACGARLGGARVRLTDRYLLVDEGRANGFGLPLSWLADAALVTAVPADVAASEGDAAIHLRYEDGLTIRRFVLRPRQGPRDAQDPRRGEQVAAALAAVGVARRVAAPAEPSLTVDWEAAGLSDLEILDITHATAMFAWANRLMQTLGEGEPAGDPPAQGGQRGAQ